MYLTLLLIHNSLRWVVLATLLHCIYRALRGYRGKAEFSQRDNAFRHWTATAVQVQMMIGFVLYFNSPFVSAYRNGSSTDGDSSFFAVVHLALMFLAVTIISIGSAMAKRRPADQQKYQTMLIWFAIGLMIILIAIPWPFSPFAQRPYFRIS
jgi:cell division protein FtsW (lipid II flippase)